MSVGEVLVTAWPILIPVAVLACLAWWWQHADRRRAASKDRRSLAPRQHDSITYPDGATRHALSCWCRNPR